jgi:hypothetical protein
MSLHARIAIGPSRRAMVLERGVVLGGLGLMTATCVVRFASMPALLIGVAVGAMVLWSTVRSLRSQRIPTLFVLDESARIEAHREAARSVEQFELAEDSLVWPGLMVLRLMPSAVAGAAPRSVVAFDRELATDDRRALRRYLLWVSRGGVRPELSIDRSS